MPFTQLTTDDRRLTTVSNQRYLPFGEVRIDVGTPFTQTDFGYTGQRSNTYIKLIDYGARWYSSSLGRFTQPDSIVPDLTNTQAWNRFSYVNNNPVNFNDPTGHIPYGENEDDTCLPSQDCWEENGYGGGGGGRGQGGESSENTDQTDLDDALQVENYQDILLSCTEYWTPTIWNWERENHCKSGWIFISSQNLDYINLWTDLGARASKWEGDVQAEWVRNDAILGAEFWLANKAAKGSGVDFIIKGLIGGTTTLMYYLQAEVMDNVGNSMNQFGALRDESKDYLHREHDVVITFYTNPSTNQVTFNVTASNGSSVIVGNSFTMIGELAWELMGGLTP